MDETVNDSKKRITLSEFGKTLLFHMRENGVSFKDISAFSGISNTTCTRLLKDCDVKIENKLKIDVGSLKNNRFYVYVHKADGKIFYIGKGTGNRYKDRNGRSKEWNEIVNKSFFTSEIIKGELSENEAFNLESHLIKEHIKNGGVLVNKTSSNHAVKLIDKSVFEGKIKYDESSSTFLRWICSAKGTSIGDEAGCLNKRNNYHTVSVDKKSYLVHRVIVTLFDIPLTPELVVDHIDGNRLNNSISNLRVVSKQVNLRNKMKPATNTGIKGISLIYRKSQNSWCYRVRWTNTIGKDQAKLVKTIEGGRQEDLDKAIRIRDSVYSELKLLGLEL